MALIGATFSRPPTAFAQRSTAVSAASAAEVMNKVVMRSVLRRRMRGLLVSEVAAGDVARREEVESGRQRRAGEQSRPRQLAGSEVGLTMHQVKDSVALSQMAGELFGDGDGDGHAERDQQRPPEV